MRSWSLRSEHYRSSLSNRQRGLWINQWLHPYSRYWRRYSRYLFWIWLQGSGLSWLCASPPPVTSLILLAQISVHHTQGRDCRVPQGYNEGPVTKATVSTIIHIGMIVYYTSLDCFINKLSDDGWWAWGKRLYFLIRSGITWFFSICFFLVSNYIWQKLDRRSTICHM